MTARADLVAQYTQKMKDMAEVKDRQKALENQ